MENLKFKVEIDSSASTKALKEIGTAAGAASSEVSSSMASAESSIREAGNAANTAAAKTKELGDAAGDTATSAGQLSGALDLVSPAAGDVARVVADAADALEVFTKALNVSKAVAGPVAIAIAAVGAAYLYLKDQLNEAEAAQEAMSEAATVAEGRFASLKGLVSALADEMRILNGVSELDIELERQQEEINAQYRVGIRHIDEQIRKKRELQQAASEDPMGQGLAGSFARQIENLEALRENTIRARDEALLGAEFVIESRRAETQAIEEERAALEALRAAEASAREAAAETAAAEAAASKLEQERFANKAAETAAEMERLEELAALEERIAEERDARDEAAHQAAMERIEERRIATEQALGSSVALFGSLSEGFQMMAESQAAAGSEGALKSFEIAQRLAIAEVIFSTAKGIMAAMALPPPANVIQAGAVSAASAVQLATIAAQSPPTAHMGDTGLTQRMHMGGTVDSAGQQTVILRNEAVLDSATTRRLGPEGVQSLLNGAAPARASRTVVTYRHLDQAVGDLLKNNGSRSARSARSAARQPSSMGTTRAYQ